MNVVLKLLGGLAALLAILACVIVLFTFTPLSSTPIGQSVHACSDLALTLQQMLPLMPLA